MSDDDTLETRDQREARRVLGREYRFVGCVVCGLEVEAVLQAAHLDHNAANNDADNLAWLCPTHHWMTDHGLYPLEAIKLLRAHWEKTEGQPDHAAVMKDAGPKAALRRRRNAAMRGKTPLFPDHDAAERSSIPTADEFRSELRTQLRVAELAGKPSVDINAGELHRKVGGYPGSAHRMPNCCSVMRQELHAGDVIVSERASDGASFTVAEVGRAGETPARGAEARRVNHATATY